MEIKTLISAEIGREYFIKGVADVEPDLEKFLLSLGCYKGQLITVGSKRRNIFNVTIKDARYAIDEDLASAIII